MKATDILRMDHQKVTALLQQIQTASGRNEIFLRQIYDSLKIHGQCEEQFSIPWSWASIRR